METPASAKRQPGRREHKREQEGSRRIQEGREGGRGRGEEKDQTGRKHEKTRGIARYEIKKKKRKRREL